PPAHGHRKPPPSAAKCRSPLPLVVGLSPARTVVPLVPGPLYFASVRPRGKGGSRLPAPPERVTCCDRDVIGSPSPEPMPSSLSALLRDAAARHPDRPAIGQQEGVTTYAELAADVERVAGHLHALGLGGQRLALLLPNLPTLPLALYGGWRAGCAVLLLNPLNSPREISEHLDDAGVDTVLTSRALADLLPPGSTALLVDDLP